MAIKYNTSIVRSGLVLHLDAANTKSNPGSGTAWYDLSGNGNHGTLVNSPTFNSSNKGSFIFDGTNDFITLPASNIVIPSTSFTCAVWVSAPSTIDTVDDNAGGRFVTVLRSAASSFFGLGLKGDNTDTIQIFISGGTTFLYPNSGIVGAGFNYISFTYNSTTSSLNFYINGQIKATHSTAFLTPSVDTASLASIATNYYACSIANFSTYNRVLSATEISQNFEALRGRYGV